MRAEVAGSAPGCRGPAVSNLRSAGNQEPQQQRGRRTPHVCMAMADARLPPEGSRRKSPQLSGRAGKGETLGGLWVPSSTPLIRMW